MAESALARLKASAGSVPSPSTGVGIKEPSGIEEVVSMIVRVLISHERDIHELQDLDTVVFLVYSDQAKKEVKAIRDLWVSTKPEGDNQPHPTGSQRSLIFASLITQLHQAYTAMEDRSAPVVAARDAAKKLCDYETSDIDLNVFRLKTRYKEPLMGDKRPWAWQLLLSKQATRAFVEAVYAVAAYGNRPEGIALQPSRSIDGPLIKALSAWLAKQSGAKSGNEEEKRRKVRAAPQDGSG
eukprot:gnl/MRDRNA2_/MRDRNA2_80611_c0_seq1.p1 gnl/MRDRNA2_/MRDRNA2_80611_c0~~gnl/MRDRNA2_/MRDRNA2_80611_c0_seq1.p1  ORF type:complete len:240 (-),score=49.20 gnl/MRDRNA2_/MRDRNA2_80611_c0_seq1:123-842(-)